MSHEFRCSIQILQRLAAATEAYGESKIEQLSTMLTKLRKVLDFCSISVLGKN